MKWFKHDSTALHDAKIQKLIMKYGIAGYGLYFACVEIIAGNLTPQNINFELEHDSEILAHLFAIDTLKVEEIMKYCVTLGLFEINVDTNRITCLKLAKRLDITMSQNPELKSIIANSNFKKLLETNNPLKQIRLDKSRIDKTSKDKDKNPSNSSKIKDPLGTEAKECFDYHHTRYVERTEEKPTGSAGAGIKLLKILLRKYDGPAVREVMDAFFEWDRADYTLKRFYNRFDIVRYKLKDKAEGKR